MHNAYRALYDCDQVYVIGFSLSPFDTMARLFFGGIMMERFKKKIVLPAATLVDPRADEDKLTKNFKSVFGSDISMIPVKKNAQDVNWDTVLNSR